jgi:hypothetical protein
LYSPLNKIASQFDLILSKKERIFEISSGSAGFNISTTEFSRKEQAFSKDFLYSLSNTLSITPYTYGIFVELKVSTRRIK